MENTKGTLVRWFANKGFGFIKPEQGGADVFIHITALKGQGRKPVIGDIIHYEISSDSNGKTRAVNARIEGIESVLTVKPIRKKTTHSSNVNKRTNKGPAKAPKSTKSFKSLFILLIVILGFALNSFQKSNIDFIPSIETPDSSAGTAFEIQESTTGNNQNQALNHAYENQQSDVQVSGSGIVVRTLSDDTKGSQHQRFILRLASGQTLLVAHNIDLAPRIDSLQEGDSVEFYGEYEWNSKGGVLHWTHNDPRGRHKNGWLKHNGSTYQ